MKSLRLQFAGWLSLFESGILIAGKFNHWFLARHRLRMTAACIFVAGALAHPAAAQYDLPGDAPDTGATVPLEDARRITLGVSVSHDSNFFREPGLVRDPPSETIMTGYVGLRIDKPYAQQRFFLDATATAYRYNNFSYLDFNGLDYRAAWYWQLTSRISGTLAADRTQIPTEFQDELSRQSNVTIVENYRFNVDGRLFDGWHLLLGMSWLKRSSEQESLQGQPDYHETRSEAGIKYLFPAGSSIEALWRRIDGEQDSQLVNNVIVVSTENYEEDQSEIRASWILSPASTVTARATYLDRRYDQVPQNNFSGTGGEIGYSWSPTSTLTVRLTAVRNIVPWQSLTSNYRTSNSFLLAPTWRATAKTTVYMTYQRVYDDFPAASPTVPERKDTSDYATLGATWLPTRTLSIDTRVTYRQRSSNNPLVEYDTTIGRISASLIF